MKDLIDANLLKVGTRLEPLRKHLTKTALVMADGSLQIDGVPYAAVSTAAVAVSGSKSEPGWEFWGAPSGDGSFVPLFKLRDRLRTGKGDSAAPPTAPAGSTPPATPTDLDPQEATPPGGQASDGPAQMPSRLRLDVSVKDLIDAGLVAAGDELVTMRRGRDHRAKVMPDGTIRVGESTYQSLSGAAKAASGNTAEPGWEFWALQRGGPPISLYAVRDDFLKRKREP